MLCFLLIRWHQEHALSCMFPGATLLKEHIYHIYCHMWMGKALLLLTHMEQTAFWVCSAPWYALFFSLIRWHQETCTVMHVSWCHLIKENIAISVTYCHMWIAISVMEQTAFWVCSAFPWYALNKVAILSCRQSTHHAPGAYSHPYGTDRILGL